MPLRLALEHWITYFNRVSLTLTDPHPSIIDPQERRRARFLAAFVLSTCLLNVSLLIPLARMGLFKFGLPGMLVVAVGGFSTYLLARTRAYKTATLALMVIALVFVLATIKQNPSAHTAVLALIPIFISSLFYDARGILIMTTLSILMIIGASIAIPGDWAAVQLTLLYILNVTALTVVGNLLLRQSEANLSARSAQLMESQSRFRAAMDGSLHSFYILKRSYDNADWSILEANRLAERQAGSPRSQLISHKLLPSMLPIHCGEMMLERCKKALDSNATILDYVMTPDDHSYEYVIVPFNDCVALTINDITERKKSEKQTLDLALERERVTVLQQIIGDASHDMMSPLSALKMNMYLIKEAADAETRAPRMAAVDQQITRLQTMIRDLATMSELDHLSSSKLSLMKMDSNTLLTEIGGAYDAVATAKQHQLIIQPYSKSLPIFIDRARIEAAITNLIENAFKYTPAGSTITVAVMPHDSGVAIEVRDNGKGISEQDLPHLFERYYRAEEHRSASSTVTGTGLGLTIVKKIMEAHQGWIVAENVPEGGALFRLWLPLAPSPESVGTASGN